MGQADTIVRVAKACAKNVFVPEEIGCCAFAGDKGFTEPKLNEWALRKLKPQIQKAGATIGVSNSRTCEIGLTTHSGIEYHSIAHLVNLVSK
jgi:D-lactate dehydrogenase